jgi:hypothetical protein
LTIGDEDSKPVAIYNWAT